MGIYLPGVTREQCIKFELYLSLLIKWNKVHNLTAVRDADEIVNRHFLESIALLPHFGTSKTILDLGTGPGIPGIPLAIMRPDEQVTLLDSAQKKIAFCQEVVRACELHHVRCHLGRAESPTTQSRLGQFDHVLSRATWSLENYIPIAIPYATQKGGTITAIKGPRYTEELTKIGPLPLYVHGPNIIPVVIPSHTDRKLVLVHYTVNR